MKLANFVYFYITRGKALPHFRKVEWNPESRELNQNPRSGIWNLGSGIRNPGSGIQNAGSGIQREWNLSLPHSSWFMRGIFCALFVSVYQRIFCLHGLPDVYLRLGLFCHRYYCIPLVTSLARFCHSICHLALLFRVWLSQLARNHYLNPRNLTTLFSSFY